MTNTTNRELITEAARFGNLERMSILKDIDNFKFGMEYEFNTRDGVPYLDTLMTIYKPLDSPMIKSIAPDIEKLTKAVEMLERIGGVETLKQHVKDLDDFIADRVEQSEYGYFNDVVAPEVVQAAKIFIGGIVLPTNSIKKVYNRDSLDGLGPYSDIALSRGDIGVVDSVAKSSVNRLTPQNARALRMAASVIQRYMVLDLDGKSPRMSQKQHYNGILDILHADVVDYQKNNPSKLEVVQKELGIPKQFIDKIAPDMTVPNGVEVITKPLRWRDSMAVMGEVFSYIQKSGYTDNSTGLHVNISVGNKYNIDSVNTAKMLVLMDVDFFQGLSRGVRDVVKYPVRSDWVAPIFKFLKDTNGEAIKRLAVAYARGDVDLFVETFERYVRDTNAKERAVNLRHLLNADVSQRRIEFRFFGGNAQAGYEFRYDEIQRDILQICYVIAASTDESFLRREYLQGIVRVMDRATKETKIDGMQFNSFSSVVNYYRTKK